MKLCSSVLIQLEKNLVVLFTAVTKADTEFLRKPIFMKVLTIESVIEKEVESAVMPPDYFNDGTLP